MANNAVLGIIMAPVGLASDIKTIVGKNSLAQACQSNIYLWSESKPVVYTGDASNPTWWKGDDGNCGFAPKRLGSPEDSKNYCSGGLNGWSYTPPRGGAAAPFRMLFFKNYFHNAALANYQPKVSVSSSQQNLGSGLTFRTQFTFTLSWSRGVIADEIRTLLLSDIGVINGAKFGVYMTDGGGNGGQSTSTSTISTSSNSISVSINMFVMGIYTAYFFIQKNGVYYSIPLAKSIGNLASVGNQTGGGSGGSGTDAEKPTVKITCTNDPFLTATFNVDLYNNTSYNINIKNASWYIKDVTHGPDDALTVDETSGTISGWANTSLSAGQHKYANGLSGNINAGLRLKAAFNLIAVITYTTSAGVQKSVSDTQVVYINPSAS